MQERCNSIANALELRLSCTNPLIWILHGNWIECLYEKSPALLLSLCSRFNMLKSNFDIYVLCSCDWILKLHEILKFELGIVHLYWLWPDNVHTNISDLPVIIVQVIMGWHMFGAKPHLNQCWHIVILPLQNKLKWNFLWTAITLSNEI